jgi:hypothetical protein
MSQEVASTYVGTAEHAVLFNSAATNDAMKVRVTAATRLKSNSERSASNASLDTDSHNAAKAPMAEAINLTIFTRLRLANKAGIHLEETNHAKTLTRCTGTKQLPVM